MIVQVPHGILATMRRALLTSRARAIPPALALALLSGCVLAPLDLEGRRCPCAEGFQCVDAGGVGVCLSRIPDAGADAQPPRDGGTDARVDASVDASIDGGACPAGAPTACVDGVVCANGVQRRALCAEDALLTCEGDALRTLPCPAACTSDGRTCAFTPRFLEALPSAAGVGDARFTAGDRPVWVLDTDRGEITRFADRRLSSAGMAATVDGLVFDGVQRAFVADTLVIEPGVTVIGRGTRPLVIYARHTLEVGALATVSVSAQGIDPGPAGALGASVGGEGSAPGSGPGGGQSCVAPSTTIHKTGGAGGGFGTRGGDGGRAGTGTVPASTGGSTWGSDLTRLQGGSGGGAGCVASSGGAGGGALYLLAGVEARIDGDLESGGGGGVGGSPGAGGGGGGSGGAIVVEAPRVEVRGRIAVGGGSGGQGGFNDGTAGIMVAGASGTDGSAVQIPARTPDVDGAGGLGGAGSDASGVAAAGGRGARSFERGGGGGGGAGRVWIYRLAGGSLADRVVPASVLTEGPLE